ncbi:class I SAM-dependent methyltransferase [Kordiimonas marina]|uniref:class I SAM-dependent methyltransferase n=1 Tax=Kordiimonas marina TaxID=2872312 RepID=UPI001FF28D34|nr:class I SAM-dependent methyltransferase [Kordiimonas marina]MCJ9428658.1 class I SAM-dependent methyltransferase [Kordiimonas marina]
MSFQDHFSADSAGYKAFRPVYDDGLAALLAKDLPGHALAIDVGCGNGQFSVHLADHFDQVIAYDGSAEQIKHAEARPNIDYRVGTAEALDAAPESVDLITAMQAAHWFDLPAFYHAADRVLKPGGRLALVGYGLMDLPPELEAPFLHFYRDIIGPYWPADRAHIETRYSKFSFPYAEDPDPGYALTADWSVEQLINYMNTWSSVKRATRQLGANPLDAYAPTLRQAWGDVETRHIRWPLFMRWGRKPL